MICPQCLHDVWRIIVAHPSVSIWIWLEKAVDIAVHAANFVLAQNVVLVIYQCFQFVKTFKNTIVFFFVRKMFYVSHCLSLESILSPGAAGIASALATGPITRAPWAPWVVPAVWAEAPGSGQKAPDLGATAVARHRWCGGVPNFSQMSACLTEFNLLNLFVIICLFWDTKKSATSCLEDSLREAWGHC